MSLRYVTWRNGRPRFNPSARERALGFRGHDLRHGSRWFTFEEAEAYSEAIYKEITDARGPNARRRRSVPLSIGYVYFMFCGDEVKIGYSRGPLRRQRELATAMTREPDILIAVRGGRGHETALHRRHRADHIKQEWFRRSPAILRSVLEMAEDPAAVFDSFQQKPTDVKPDNIG